MGAAPPCKAQLGKLTLRKHLSLPSLPDHSSLSKPSWGEEEGPTNLSHGRSASLPHTPTAPGPQVSYRCDRHQSPGRPPCVSVRAGQTPLADPSSQLNTQPRVAEAIHHTEPAKRMEIREGGSYHLFS